MVTDAQVRRLMKLMQKEDTLALAAAKAGMDEKPARKYRRSGQLPSQLKRRHTWRNRPDAFEKVWPDLEQALKLNPGLEAKTLFQYLQRQDPGQFQDGQLRTKQRPRGCGRCRGGAAEGLYSPVARRRYKRRGRGTWP